MTLVPPDQMSPVQCGRKMGSWEEGDARGVPGPSAEALVWGFRELHTWPGKDDNECRRTGSVTLMSPSEHPGPQVGQVDVVGDPGLAEEGLPASLHPLAQLGGGESRKDTADQ